MAIYGKIREFNKIHAIYTTFLDGAFNRILKMQKWQKQAKSGKNAYF